MKRIVGLLLSLILLSMPFYGHAQSVPFTNMPLLGSMIDSEFWETYMKPTSVKNGAVITYQCSSAFTFRSTSNTVWKSSKLSLNKSDGIIELPKKSPISADLQINELLLESDIILTAFDIYDYGQIYTPTNIINFRYAGIETKNTISGDYKTVKLLSGNGIYWFAPGIGLVYAQKNVDYGICSGSIWYSLESIQ